MAIESALVLLVVIISFILPGIGSRWFERMELGFACFARRRYLAVIAIGLAALSLRAALLPVLPIPEPIIHDEFGYLLAADTFAQGRLTNPTHPLSRHFETFSVLQKPTYQCFAQPMQGMLLALGTIAFGHPFWGVLLSIGIMSAAITWMLQGWLSPAWALLGGLLAVLRYGVFGYWANSYWGGAVGAIGGALVLGALPRIRATHQVRDALLMGLGLAILANSRPYEGFVLSVPVALALFAWVVGKGRPPFAISLRYVIVPISMTLSITALAMGYYCWRVTGDPIRMPYQVERQTYAAAPLFIWQALPAPHSYQHAIMQHMYVGEELQSYEISRTVVGPMLKGFSVWSFYWGPTLTLPILMMALVLPYGFSWADIHERTRFVLLLLLFMSIGLVLESFFSRHYVSPFTSALVALPLLAMRRVRAWCWRGKPSGQCLARGMVVACGIMFALRASAVPLHIDLAQSCDPAWYQRGPNGFGRAALEARLRQTPGQHLVILHYAPDHEPFEEWVYNEANIDRAKVVWARDMGSYRNQELIAHFADRKIWWFEPDKDRQALSPYPLRPAVDLSATEEGR
jgi:hypothetical protein